MSTVVFFGAFVVALGNIKVYTTVRKQLRKIAATTVYRRQSMERSKELSSMKKKQMRSLLICTFISCSYIAFWVPFHIVLFIYDYELGSGEPAITYAQVFGSFNALIDVCIYILLSKERRLVFLNTFKFDKQIP
eukprot:TCONS_00002007-protein